MLKAFHNDIKIKKKYLNQVKAHDKYAESPLKTLRKL